jgi:ABC-type transport system substrate-binding protein
MGGIMLDRIASEGPHFDPTTGGVAVFVHAAHAYSRLVRYASATVFNPPDGTVEGDLAESWEYSGDGLQVTLKLRPGVKLDERAPTSGRVVTTEDVKYTFDRYMELSPDRGNYFTAAVPDAPIDSVEFPDASTVVVNLSYPTGGVLRRFSGNFYIVPTEAEGAFDMRQDMRGSGAWILEEHAPSSGWKYRRNSNWYMASERPFLDGIDYTLMPEPAVARAQFQAKRLWALKPPAEEVLSIKDDRPEALLMADHPFGSGISGGYMLALSKLEDSPIQKDVRIRYAISHLLDRDAWIDTFFNVTKFQSEGLPMETGWNSHISCSAAEWLDPKTDALGEGAKYFQHDPEEAAALLNAASAFGLETEFSYATTNINRPQSVQWMETIAGMLSEGGHFKLKINTGDYTQWYQPTYLRGRAQWEGIAWTPGGGGGTDIDAALWGFWAPGARNDGVYSWDIVPGLQDILTRHRQELDNEKRVAITHEFQRAMAVQMPCMLFPGLASTFSLYQPWLGNAGVYKTHAFIGEYTPDTLLHAWYDASKDDS